MEVARNAVLRRPRHGLQLVTAHRKPADFLLEITEPIRVAQRRQIGGDAIDWLGDKILVLHGLHRHGDVGQATAFTRPNAAAVDRNFALDVARFRLHGGDSTGANIEAGHAATLDDFRAFHLRTLGQGLAQIGRTRLPVGRQKRRANQVRDIHHRPKFLRFAWREQMHFQPKAVRRCRLPLDLGQALVVAGQAQTAVGFPAGRLAGFLLEFAVKIDAVFQQLRDAGRPAKLPDQAGGVKRRAAGQRLALEHNNVLPAKPRKVIGHTASDDTAADNDDPRASGKLSRFVNVRGHSRFRKSAWPWLALRLRPIRCRGTDPG